MSKPILTAFCALLFCVSAQGGTAPKPSASFLVQEVRYDGKLSDDEARFDLAVTAESSAPGENSLPLIEGDVAVLPGKLPDSLRIVRDGNRYSLVASRAGKFKFNLQFIAKIARAEPWNQISFTGPSATISSVTAESSGTNTELQLMNGTVLNTTRSNGVSRVNGFLGADRIVWLRWQSQVTRTAHKTLLTASSTLAAHVAPNVIRYTSKFHYDIVQGSVSHLTLSLPVWQSLTRLDGLQIRDWHTVTTNDQQLLTVEFIKPIESGYDLALFSEQAIDATATVSIQPPQPLEVERESGSLSLSAEDTLVETSSLAGLRQVNAREDSLASYQFNARPFELKLALKHIEPVISSADRVNSRLEETRQSITHNLALTVEKTGIYTLELVSQPGFTVTGVRGDGVDEWNARDGRITVNFSARVLGARTLEVQLERAFKEFPAQIEIAPLRVVHAEKETAQVGAASAPGIRLHTGTLAGLREIPVNRLPQQTDELLAYTADQPDWKLFIASERMEARIVADVFNLITIGDGLVGGSATIRYAISNQGVQELKVRVPANCKNIDFTGPDIRRKEESNGVWTIGLQDKVWDGYTLVVTYDFQFDGQAVTLPMDGIHTPGIERETGSVAITTAASLQLNVKSAGDTLRRIDETELSSADRSLISRAVVLAYQYTGGNYELTVDVKRYAAQPVLEAVADRTQITSVLTKNGEMLTQASFMVKNNEKQFQRFHLPKDSKLWSCYVNGQPAKPERDGDWVLLPLPRENNHDQAFTVDIVYANTNGALASFWGKPFELSAPRTDIPNTYAEWQLYAPESLRLSDFGGNMNVGAGTTYHLFDAWEKFLAFYLEVLHEAGGALFFIGVLAFLVITLVVSAARRGVNGVVTVLVVAGILMLLGGMLLPALAKAKSKAVRIKSVSNLKQVGLAMRVYGGDNGDRFPDSFEAMKNELGNPNITLDPVNGQRYTYLGAGYSEDSVTPDSVVAYDSSFNVLFADGSVQQLSASKFMQLEQRGLIVPLNANQYAKKKQSDAITRGQLEPVASAPSSAHAMPPADVNYALDSGKANGGGATEIPAPVIAVAGIRSLRIELPQTGTPILFTKVLNLRDEPLSIHARIMTMHTYQNLQMVWQTAVFLLGLLVWWSQWKRADRNFFVLALAMAMIIGSVCSLLIQWRALHDVLIIGFPVVVLAVICRLLWKYLARPRTGEKPTAFDEINLPPITAAIALLLFLGASSAQAAPLARVNVIEPSIVSAIYTGSVNDRIASVDATLEFSAVTPGEQIALFGQDVAVQQFSAKNGRAELVRDGQKISVRFGSKGHVTLQIKLLAKTTGDVTKRKLLFDIPAALSSEANFVVQEPEADIDFPGAISFKRAFEKEQTSVSAVLGSTANVELLWTPRVKRAAEIAATVFCQNHSLVRFGDGVMDITASLDYQITQGELRQARVSLPTGQRLLRVEGSDIRSWETREENGRQVLVIDLLKGVSPAWKLNVEVEKVLAPLPASELVEIPHALNVKRENGLIALRGSDESTLTPGTSTGLERVDANEFNRDGGAKIEGLASVFRFSDAAFSLPVRVEAMVPEISALVNNDIRVGADQVSLKASIAYTIKRAGIFSVKIALPGGYRLDTVSGEIIQQSTEHDEQGLHVVELTLKKRTMGLHTVSLELSRDFKELPKSLPLAGVHPLGVDKMSGYIVVATDPGIALKTGGLDGLTEISAEPFKNANVFSGATSALAYKFISTTPGGQPAWKLSVEIENLAAWIRAEIVNTFTLTETLTSGRAQIRYDIANAPVSELRVRVPAEFKNVEISGANIRSRIQEGTLWRVELQSPTRGVYNLTVTWDEPRPGKDQALALNGVSAEGVERETGLLAIAARPPIQVTESSSSELQRVDAGDLPDWAKASDVAPALVYRYIRPGYKLALDVRRFDEAEVLQALVDNAQFTSVVAEDGQMMTEMSLSVRNNGRQFLEITLPTGASVWSAFVSDQPVRPSLREGKLLVPLEQSGATDSAINVELTYVGTNRFPRKEGEVDFASPRFDVPLKNARWEFYLPLDFDYKNFSGTMSREIAPDRSLLATTFSSLDYSRMEQAKSASSRKEAARELNEARRQLAGGDTRGANANFNRARRLIGDKTTDFGIQALEKDLQGVQVTNFIVTQSGAASRGYANGGMNASVATASPMDQISNVAAGEQWNKLQQAQEIVTTKVQPLRVNLPIRGQHLAFTQVLQTEGGRPMTIQLSAIGTKIVSWPSRLLTLIGAFLVLWILVAGLSRLNLRHAQA